MRHILFLAILLGPLTVAAKNIEEGYGKLLRAISSLIRQPADSTAILLEDLGYRPAAGDEVLWGNYPAIRKIEIAYRAAERRGKKGQELLSAIMSSDIVEKFLGEEEKTSQKRCKKIKFSRKPECILLQIPISEDVKMAILQIARYTDRGSLGGIQGVLQHYFRVPDQAIYQLLATGDDDFHVLFAASETVAMRGNELGRLLTDVARDMQNFYAGARANEELRKVYLPKEKVRMPNGEPRHNPRAQTLSSIKYKQYIGRDTLPVDRNFDHMITDRGRWGGIILGNTVIANSQSINQLPTVLRWLPDDERRGEPVSGVLEISIAGKQAPVSTRTVFLEDVYAAYELLFAEDGLTFHVGSGEGAGMINALGRRNSQFGITVNPAVANFELGRCLARADVWPGMEDLLRAMTDTSLFTAAQLLIIDSLMTCTHSGCWKFCDAPMCVQVKNGFLEAVAAGAGIEPEYPLYFYYCNPTGEAYSPFYAAIPVLCNAFYDYDRMCSFAKTFAIMRWAKENGAAFANRPHLPSMTVTPSIVYPAIERRQLVVEGW